MTIENLGSRLIDKSSETEFIAKDASQDTRLGVKEVKRAGCLGVRARNESDDGRGRPADGPRFQTRSENSADFTGEKIGDRSVYARGGINEREKTIPIGRDGDPTS